MADKLLQSFQMCLQIETPISEYLENVDSCSELTEEDKQRSHDDLKEEKLVMPVRTVQFYYPYTRLCHFVLDTAVTTKHELIAGIQKELPKYLKSHRYSAPHNLSDFVIETLEIYYLNESFGTVYMELGS